MAEIVTLRDRSETPFSDLPLSGPNGPANQADQTPGVDTGSFSLDRSTSTDLVPTFVRPSILPGHGHILPEYPTRPIDPITGLPACFAPSSSTPPIRKPARIQDRVGDWDHLYPRVETRYGANPVLQQPYAALALMNSRVQWISYVTHHNVWNNAEYIGPMQPNSLPQLAATLIFALSNYIPPVGIDFRNGKAMEVLLPDKSKEHLWLNGEVMIGSETSVLLFLRRYVALQRLDHLRQSDVDEFLHTFNPQRKVELATQLANKVIERAVEPLDVSYMQARRGGLSAMRNGRGTIVRAPDNPVEFVAERVFGGNVLMLTQAITPRIADFAKAA